MANFAKQNISTYLSKFSISGELFLNIEDAKNNSGLPVVWLDFITGTVEERISKLLHYWQPIAQRFPSVIDFLKNKISAPIILKENSGEISLLYPFAIDSGEVHIYRGRMPLGDNDRATPLFSSLPDDLKFFYESIHNGWTFVPDNAMGPLPFKECGMLDDILDMTDSEIDALSPNPRAVLRTFHNGTGNYICLNLKKSQGDGWDAGILWDKEKPEYLKPVDFWAYTNAWMEIFFENAVSPHS